MQRFLPLILLVLLTGCNAFTDADELGPTPGDPNVDPGNNTSANNISTNNIIANNIFPANNNTSTNNVACLDPTLCGTCESTGRSVVCDDPICPTFVEEGPCPSGEGCVNGFCEPCQNRCNDGTAQCIDDSQLADCVTDRWGCEGVIEYECTFDPCSDTIPDGASCDMAGKPCTQADVGGRYCASATKVVRCNELSPTEYIWEVVNECMAGTRCNPQADSD